MNILNIRNEVQEAIQEQHKAPLLAILLIIFVKPLS